MNGRVFNELTDETLFRGTLYDCMKYALKYHKDDNSIKVGGNWFLQYEDSNTVYEEVYSNEYTASMRNNEVSSEGYEKNYVFQK